MDVAEVGHTALTDRSAVDDSAFTDTKLRFWNRVAASLHFVQFVFMAVASTTVSNFRDFELDLTYSYFESESDDRGLARAVGVITQIRVAPLCALFFLLSAVFQGATTVNSPFRFHDIYNADLERCQNRFRWYEYAISSSVMIWVIAMFVGVSDVCSLICIFGINMCMNFFGLLMEHENSGAATATVTWRPFWFGCVAGIPPWISVITGLATSSSPPGFVYGIFISYIIMFGLFPLNMVLQFKRVGKWADYRFGEFVYIVLSLVAKSLLGWFVFGGLNQPNSNTD